MASEKDSKIQSGVGGEQPKPASPPGAAVPDVPTPAAAASANPTPDPAVSAPASSPAPSVPTPAAVASAPASSVATSGLTSAAAASAPARSASIPKSRPPGVPRLEIPASPSLEATQSPASAIPVAPQSPAAATPVVNSSPEARPVDVDNPVAAATGQRGNAPVIPIAPAANVSPPGTPIASPRDLIDTIDDWFNDFDRTPRAPNVAKPVSPPPPSVASSSAAGGAPSAPVGANKSYSDQLDELLNNATSTSAKPLAAAGAPSAAAVPLGGNPSRPPPAVASAPAASGQAPGQLGGTPLRNPERSGSPPPARPVPLGGQARQWVPPASRSGENTPGAQSERAPAAPNAGTVPVQGIRAVPWQPGRPAADTPTGSAATAAPTPAITQLMGEMRKLDREAESLRNITKKWDESVKAELQNKGISIENCDRDRGALFKTLLEFKSGTPPAENTAIEAIVKRRDDAVLRGANQDITAFTKELTKIMGAKENDTDIKGNLEERDEILQKIKQANDIESAHTMKLPGNGLVGPDGSHKEEFNKADIAIYQTRLQEIAQQMAALKQQIRTAQDTPRVSAPEPNDALENPNPGDPRKKIEDVVKLIAQDPNVNNCKKVSEGEYQLDFKTVPPAPINVSKNKVTAPKGADETTMRKQCQVFFDLMDKTGRKDFSLDDVKVSGADEVKLKALLAEEFAKRYGTSISLNARDPITPTPPIEPPSVTASIGGPRGGMGGHRS